MSPKPEKNAPNALRRIRRARDLTMAALAEMVGTDASTINKLEKGEMRLTDKWIGPIAAALAVTADELLSQDATPMPPASEVRAAPVTVPDRESMPLDLPIYGTAAGSHMRGAFQISHDVIDYVRRPPALMGARSAYAIYIEGSSMAPEHNHGDLRFVHPGRPAKLGDSVVVQAVINSADAPEASIGHLRRRVGDSTVLIAKLNPPAEIEIRRVTAIHKVLSLNELFGV